MDSSKETLSDYVVKFDSKKEKATHEGQREEKESEVAKKILHKFTNDEFIDRNNAFRNINDINLKNPEYIMTFSIE